MWLHQGNQGPRHRRTSIGRFDPGRLLLTGQKLGQGRKKGLCVLKQADVAVAPHGVPSGVMGHDVWELVFGELVLWHDVLALVDGVGCVLWIDLV